MSLLISTVADGSRKSDAPLAELPCTIPGTLARCSARTMRTYRPLRSVITSSWRYFDVSLPRTNCSSVAAQPVAFLAQPIPDAPQLSARVVEHLPRCIDGAPHRGDLLLEGGDARNETGEDRKRSAGVSHGASRLFDRIDEVRQAAKRERLERTALDVERGKRIWQVARGAQRERERSSPDTRSSRSSTRAPAQPSRGRYPARVETGPACRAGSRRSRSRDRRCDRIRACVRQAWSGERAGRSGGLVMRLWSGGSGRSGVG